MADKRISQLVDRGTIANNDVVPIVVSGASTTNKATISSIQTFMQGNLDMGVTSVGITLGSSGTDVNVTGSPVTSSGNITINFPTASATNRGLLSAANWSTFNSKVSSVGLSMPSAFSVANSPITGSGTIAVTGAGTVSQYIRGDGSLADFPAAGGGGSSVSYYLNGSVSQGTIGGIAYQEMNKVPVLGAGTDFTIAADGYIASFITDAGDPALLNIPAGNWNFETYLQASSGGGSPTFYIELYKVDSGGTATLIASNSANPELIAFGTVINPYFSALAVPSTVLTLTDRLALRYYVAHSGRTITLHTENTTLCQIITTFTTGLTALNGLTAQVQNFATGTSGTDFAISSSVSTHTFNLPDASASARGVVTTGSQIFGGVKTFANGLSLSAVGGSNQVTRIVNIGTLHEGTASLNQIGFNSGNNIYFGKGLNNGGVIQWTNAAVRYYTLPDADGTFALTSDLNGYVTLATTQTITGAKTFDTTTSTFALMNSTNANGGVLTFRRNGTNVGHIGNSAQLGGGVLDAIEVRSGIGSSVILKTDGGQVTLATGGGVTLTGALNGTTSTFTNSGAGIGVGVTNSNASGDGIKITHSAGRAFNIQSSGAGYGIIINNDTASTSAPFTIQKNGGSVITMTDAGAATFTGALNGTSASFSGAVSTGRLTATGSDFHSFIVPGGTAQIKLERTSSSTGLMYIGADSDGFSVMNPSFSKVTTISSTGAATFSSSVTALKYIANAQATYSSLTYEETLKYSSSPAGIWFGNSFNSNNNVALQLRTSNDGTSVQALTLASTGAATFSSSVTAGVSGGKSFSANHSSAYSFLYSTINGASDIAFDNSAGSLMIYTGGANRLTISSTGAATFSSSAFDVAKFNSTYGQSDIVIQNNGTSFAVFGSGVSVCSTAANDDTGIGTAGLNKNIVFATGTGYTERMRITSGGAVLFGTQSGSGIPTGSSVNQGVDISGGVISIQTNNNANNYWSKASGFTSGDFTAHFVNGSYVGGISTNGSTTTYAVASDYRLKEDFQEINGLEKVQAIKVYDYKWKESEERMDGVIAHELQEVLPYAVVGEKDAERMQSVDYSKIVPVLIKAIQELTEQVEALKSQING